MTTNVQYFNILYKNWQFSGIKIFMTNFYNQMQIIYQTFAAVIQLNIQNLHDPYEPKNPQEAQAFKAMIQTFVIIQFFNFVQTASKVGSNSFKSLDHNFNFTKTNWLIFKLIYFAMNRFLTI